MKSHNRQVLNDGQEDRLPLKENEHSMTVVMNPHSMSRSGGTAGNSGGDDDKDDDDNKSQSSDGMSCVAKHAVIIVILYYRFFCSKCQTEIYSSRRCRR